MKKFLLFVFLVFVSTINYYKDTDKITIIGDSYIEEYSSEKHELNYNQSVTTAYIEINHQLSKDEITIDNGYFETYNQYYYNQMSFSFEHESLIFKHIPLIIVVTRLPLYELYNQLSQLNDESYISHINLYNEIPLYDRDPIEDDDGTGGSGGDGPNPPNYLTVPGENGLTDMDVKVGILDTSIPNFNDSMIDDMNWVLQYPYYYVTNSHSTDVTKVMVNQYPSVENYTIYATKAIYPYQIMNSISWFISNDVKLINMSIGLSNVKSYESNHKFLDFIAYQYNILFVAANTQKNEYGFNWENSYPGVGYNTLLVGAVENGNYRYWSGFIEDDDEANKPNVVDEFYNHNQTSYGTSYSTPRVTAKIIEMMHNFPCLRTNLPLLLSIIHSSSTTNDLMIQPTYGFNGGFEYQSSGLEDKIGTGIISSTFANDSISNGYYAIVSTEGYDVSDVIYSTSFSVNTTLRFYASSVTLANVSKVNSSYIFNGLIGYSLHLYSNGHEVKAASDNNIYYITHDLIPNITYSIELKLLSRFNHSDENITLSWRLSNE